MIERELNAKTQAAIDQISKSVQDLTGSIESSANAQLRFKLNSGSIYGGRHSNMTFALFA